jgi:enoyl-CoA hydratase/carnithine racemase
MTPNDGSRATSEFRDTAGERDRRLVSLVVRGTVAEIALDNGPLNLVTAALLRALNDILDALADGADVRCTIVHGGNARAFCAGSDVREFATLRHDASERKILFEDMVLRRLAKLPMPTIAAIDAPALGGGVELALACDLRIVRRGVALGLPESRIGGLAANGALRLTRLIGPARAKEMLFTGRTVAGDEALAWGLVNQVTDASAIGAARDLAASIASRGPISNRLAKKLVDTAFDLPLDAGLSMSTVAQQEIFDSDDLHEGTAAFLEKREPVFRGS